MPIELVTLLMFGGLVVLLVFGLPIAFATGGIGVLTLFLLWGSDSFYLIFSRVYGVVSSYPLVAIPLFIWMGITLERSGIAGALFKAIHQWTGFINGGLAVATVLVCAAMAAMTGIVGAAVVTMGIIALPALLERRYSKTLALGSSAAGGSLGVLIPPSIPLIVYAVAAGVSIGKLFMGGFAAGLILVIIFSLYILIRSRLQPDLAPPLPKEELLPLRERVVLLRSVILPVLLIVAVLGSIFAGIATPTEAAGVGAFGALICAAIRRSVNWQMFKQVTYDSAKLTCMVLWVIFGASLFVAVFTGAGGGTLVEHVLLGVIQNPQLILLTMMAVLFILGCFLDTLAIILLTAPIFSPIIVTLGFNPVWFGIIFNVNLQMAYITPPFGYSLFYLKGVAPKGITIVDIYRSIWPFVILQALGLVVCILFPKSVLWLPNLMIR